MKDFEKWYKEEYPDNPPGKNQRNFVFHRAACEGWKAALDWISLQICPEAWDVGDVEFDIEQELKGENHAK
uniref:Uncharacterized protein n=1 Tax=viral metagenome TaxID=1070528 RepID=A0A6H1ZYE6_9ZZZZ